MMINLTGNQISLSGDWVLKNLNQINALIKKIELKDYVNKSIKINVEGIASLDTSGGYCLLNWIKDLNASKTATEVTGFSVTHQALLDLIAERMQDHTPAQEDPHVEGIIETIGRASTALYLQIVSFIGFIGEVSLTLFSVILKPWTIRWQAFGANIQTAGVDALPIVGLLNFLIGVVLAYQGGALLKTYGANIFIVEVISISMLREMAPLITAIIVAGRTGSAFAAQIGTMSVNEEIDALKTIGISPIHQLVLPKMLAMMIALPLLTLFADIFGIFGGMVLANIYLDVSFTDFIHRIPQIMGVASFLIGISKAFIFAIIIALTGCYQGFQVKGGADSVGKQTTTAVVHSIFLVIIVDAVFSILTRNVPI
ncbi:ABC transporter permease [Gammaproteobacteria bacterium]|nr:ABC transporter permease [Gammaproteobacteria bacterium]